MWGLFPGTDGRIVERALLERADGSPTPPNGRPAPRSQRNADALVSIAQGSLEGSPGEGGSAVPLVSIFLDAELAAATDGEAGGEVALGPRIGPLTLEQILRDGSVEILKISPSGQPLSVGPTARTIPPKLRRYIIHRDGGACTVDGCRSRYRLQPHHIEPRSQGGSHDPSNLTTLCWFHHHVVVHRNGFRIDPHSPPQRRRFLQQPPWPALIQRRRPARSPLPLSTGINLPDSARQKGQCRLAWRPPSRNRRLPSAT